MSIYTMENSGGRGGETRDVLELPTILERSRECIKVMWPQLELKCGLGHKYMIDVIIWGDTGQS